MGVDIYYLTYNLSETNPVISYEVTNDIKIPYLFNSWDKAMTLADKFVSQYTNYTRVEGGGSVDKNYDEPVMTLNYYFNDIKVGVIYIWKTKLNPTEIMRYRK